MSQVDDIYLYNIYSYLTRVLGIPHETVYGLAIFGVLVGLYLILSSREVEMIVEEVFEKAKSL